LNDPIFGVIHKESPKIATKLPQPEKRTRDDWWDADALLNKRKRKRKLVELVKTQPQSSVPDITLKEVDKKLRGEFTTRLKKNHKTLYELLVRISALELSLPTAYADMEETLRLLTNNRQINVTSDRVTKATDQLIELSVIRHLAGQLKAHPEDLERVLMRLWPQEIAK